MLQTKHQKGRHTKVRMSEKSFSGNTPIPYLYAICSIMDNSCLRLLGKDGRIIKLQLPCILICFHSPASGEKVTDIKIKPQIPNSNMCLRARAHTSCTEGFQKRDTILKATVTRRQSPQHSLQLPQSPICLRRRRLAQMPDSSTTASPLWLFIR